MACDKPIGLGLIGCGAFGEFCLDAYGQMDCVRITAVCDVVKPAVDAFAERFSVPGWYDPAELFGRDDVDLVHIATPPRTHYELVMQAVAGEGAFAESGSALRLRTIANLYGQTIHLVAARDSGIENVGDLRGKRMSLSTEDSGSIVSARTVLQAYRVPEWRMVRNYDPPEVAAQLLRDGELDAFFFVGAAPVALIEQLIAEGTAVLVPFDGVGRDRLLARYDYLSSAMLPPGTYPGTDGLETINVATLWVTNVATPNTLVYAMVKAIYNPNNRPQIEAGKIGTSFLELETAMTGSPVAFHPGALQYFAEAGILPAPVNPSLPVPKP
nr:MAG: TAXI family TRAP transporter solute-binding subunit [Hyphomicrobiales bacterium]